MRKLLTAAVIAALPFGAAACDDTIEGLEEDAEQIEQEVQEGVDEEPAD